MSRSYTPGRPKRPKPQRERLLDYLHAAGSRGLTQRELLNPPDGPPIMRVASRVHDLVKAGHRVEVRGRRDGLAVYVLIRDRQAQPRTPPPASPEQPAPALFEPRSAGPSTHDRLPLDPWGEDER